MSDARRHSIVLLLLVVVFTRAIAQDVKGAAINVCNDLILNDLFDMTPCQKIGMIEKWVCSCEAMSMCSIAEHTHAYSINAHT
jgi:hypothetical protein